jgi:Homocysteine S-methyltransferase
MHVRVLRRLAQVAECFVHVYSNAGLPNAMGGYDDTPQDMARDNHVFAEEGLVNMIGGCCGSTPPHIKVLYIVSYTVCVWHFWHIGLLLSVRAQQGKRTCGISAG